MPRYERSLAEYVDDLGSFVEDDETGLPKPFPTGIKGKGRGKSENPADRRLRTEFVLSSRRV